MTDGAWDTWFSAVVIAGFISGILTIFAALTASDHGGEVAGLVACFFGGIVAFDIGLALVLTIIRLALTARG